MPSAMASETPRQRCGTTTILPFWAGITKFQLEPLDRKSANRCVAGVVGPVLRISRRHAQIQRFLGFSKRKAAGTGKAFDARDRGPNRKFRIESVERSGRQNELRSKTESVAHRC